jgi:hypothetical protein
MANANSTPVLNHVARRDYKPHRSYITSLALPFVSCPDNTVRNINRWNVAKAESYDAAKRMGLEYGAHFAQYLKDNPGAEGLCNLGLIAAAIDFSDESESQGYWVGFFSYLEKLVAAAAIRVDVFEEALNHG